ncbi:MAG: hypothetical protein HRU26_12215 [Psychroserpens sp.]|nr:hypothetical protein [Psychroserpens sp.]
MPTLTIPLADVHVINETIKAINEGYRIISHRGGTRSSKTYSIIQFLIWSSYQPEYSNHISVTSCAFPHLRRGAYRDWKEQMYKLDYNEDHHVKSEDLYNYQTGSMMEFFSVDNALKVRGPGRDILYVNEANLLGNKDAFFQLLLRTRKFCIIDYNPADEFHWIYDDVETRDDCKLIVSTYKDNPFLPEEQVKEIERLKQLGGNYWQVYGLGEIGASEGLIYPNHVIFDYDMPDAKAKGYGLDFGFSSDPTAFIQVHADNENTWEKELIYETGLTNQDLITRFKALGIPKSSVIYADSSEPQRIEEIKRAGYMIKPVKKGPDSIRMGIDALKRKKRHIHKSSTNLIKETKSYSYQIDKDGKPTNNPIQYNDHAQDAVRYFNHMITTNPITQPKLYRRDTMRSRRR